MPLETRCHGPVKRPVVEVLIKEFNRRRKALGSIPITAPGFDSLMGYNRLGRRAISAVF
jgi:hypothetical protein